jgi:protein TonB
MSAAVEPCEGDGGATALHWAVCLGVVLSIHVGVALFLLREGLRSTEQPAGAPPPDVITLDLAPEAATPSSSPPPSEPQPPPEPPEPPAPVAAAEPPPPVPAPIPMPVPPAPTPDVPAPELTPVPPPQTSVPDLSEPLPPPPPRPAARPAEHHPPPARPVPPRQSAPRQESVREAKPNQSAAPSAPAPPAPTVTPPSPGAVSGWRNALIQKLQQAKRYPEAARQRDEQGVATVRFTMDRDGHVLSVNLVQGSGSETLDQ